MSSSLNLSPSCPGLLDSQHFHSIFPVALPCHQQNILYVAILQQPSLVAELERQSLYKEDKSLHSLVCIFHHPCSTQIYLESLEPQNNHVVSSTLHMASTLDDVLDTIHDDGFYHHVIALPPHNLTLTHIFHPIYCTLMAVEQGMYEESDLRLVDHISPPTAVLPIPVPSTPSTTSAETTVPSPSSTTLTLVNEPADSCPAFQQNYTTSYPTHVVS